MEAHVSLQMPPNPRPARKLRNRTFQQLVISCCKAVLQQLARRGFGAQEDLLCHCVAYPLSPSLSHPHPRRGAPELMPASVQTELRLEPTCIPDGLAFRKHTAPNSPFKLSYCMSTHAPTLQPKAQRPLRDTPRSATHSVRSSLPRLSNL